MNFFKKIFIILESIILILASFSIAYWISISVYEYLLSNEYFTSWALVVRVILLCILMPVAAMFTFWDFGEAKKKWQNI